MWLLASNNVAVIFKLKRCEFMTGLSDVQRSRLWGMNTLRQTANLCCLCALLNIGIVSAGADTMPIRKVIHQYALISGNDFPQRDPRDWRLLGSNDGGRTWVTLDVRTNEIFQTRQQRKVYKIQNETAFGTYRLEIDRTRDPSGANSVQLAEIELMGRSEDDHGPTPLFTDVISAQGDNPPAETVANLFDGRVETKWVDFAPDKSTRASWVQWQYEDSTKTVVTNISQLSALRTQASRGIRTRIQAVVVGREGSQICLADATDCILLGCLTGTEAARAGQTVLISGISQWSDNQVGIKVSSIQFPGSMPSISPERISLEQPLSQGDNLKWVEIEGEIQYPHLTGSGISFDIQDSQSDMWVRFPLQENSVHLPRPGTKIVVRGICLGGFNERGQWVAADIWAAGPNSLSIADTNITDETQTVSQATAKQTSSSPAILVTIGQIRRLTQEELATHPRVKIRCVITDVLQGFVQDDTAGIEAAFSRDAKSKLPRFGEYIEIEGWAQLDDIGSPEIWADQIMVLGRGKLPRPQTLTPDQLASGRIDAQWVEAEGVVRSTDGSHLLLTCYGQQMMATITEAQVKLVDSLVDAEIRVLGVGVTAKDNRGRVQGIHILIPSLDCVDIITPPPKPKMLPVRSIASLLGLNEPGELLHRVKVEGVVTSQQNQRVFLQDDTGSAMAILKEDVVLNGHFGQSHWLYWQTTPTEIPSNSDLIFHPGDRVQVVGFPETRRYSPVLTEAIVTALGAREALNPTTLTPNGLAEGGLDSSLVTFDAVLRGQTLIGANLVLDLEWQDRILQVLMPAQKSDSFKFELGSRLRVIGVCQIDPPSDPELGLAHGPIRILARSPEDLVVLVRPPWWTVRRALTLMGVMTFMILAGLFWIRVLRRQVSDRTRQLSAEIQLRERAESRHALEQERARIAKDLHDDLGANLTQIIFLSERVEVARNDGQNVNRWFNLIPATAQRTIQSLDEIVWAINPRHDSLESLANYLSQFAQQHLTLAHIRCVLDVPTVLPSVALSAEVRHNLLLMTREALQNIVTHAGATEVHLSLKTDEGGLNIVISDNGKGFDPRSVSPHGNGLQNMEYRAKAIGGRLGISTKLGQGTIVSFFVPHSLLHGRVIGRNRVSDQYS
jgi:signal transduction histidine kinase